MFRNCPTVITALLKKLNFYFISTFTSVINVTLPDEKQNYVHRIGRVGRAERMGLAISFVSALKEKVRDVIF